VARFWHPLEWRLEVELRQLNRSIHSMASVVDAIPCDRKFFLPFEYLKREADTALAALAAFLGLDDLTSLVDWHRQGFGGDDNHPPRWPLPEATDNNTKHPPRWPLPEATDCLAKYDGLIRRKLIPAAQRQEWPEAWVGQPASAQVVETNVAHVVDERGSESFLRSDHRPIFSSLSPSLACDDFDSSQEPPPCVHHYEEDDDERDGDQDTQEGTAVPTRAALCREETIVTFRAHLTVFVHGTIAKDTDDGLVPIPKRPMSFCARRELRLDRPATL